MPAHTITITEKTGARKTIHTGETFGTDAKGHRLPPHEVQQIARDIAWDTFGTRVQSVTCTKKK